MLTFVVSCWRPTVDIVEDVPLALCRRGTVRQVDWLPYDRVDGSSMPGEGMFLKHHPAQEWFWLPNQSNRDMTVFECWNSQTTSFDGKS